MPNTTRTPHETRVVQCLTPSCEAFRVEAVQYAMNLALDPVFYEKQERVNALVFFPLTCGCCGMSMANVQLGEE